MMIDVSLLGTNFLSRLVVSIVERSERFTFGRFYVGPAK
jgi:hypothetical protein